MSDGLSIRITQDSLSPAVARLTRALADKRPILRVMGLELTSITKRNFQGSGLMRPSVWAPKRDGKPSRLKLTTTLSKSIRITGLTSHSVSVGTDRKYAAIHQLGGVIRPKNGKALVFVIGGKKIFAKKVTIPARPFFPFSPGGAMIPAAQERIRKAVERKLASLTG